MRRKASHAKRAPKLFVFTPTYGDKLRPETVAGIEAQQFAGTLDYRIGRHNPYPDGDLRNVTAQYALARQLFLGGEWDALLAVEHDMVIPPHAAQTLYDSDGDVVYGAYLLRQGYVLNTRRMDGSVLGQRPPDDCAETPGLGFGCTLMRRSVLERIAFRPDPATGTCDATFAADCAAAGVRQVVRFDVACGHIVQGVVMQPYRDAETGLVQAWPTQR